jgi:hypothetical protein
VENSNAELSNDWAEGGAYSHRTIDDTRLLNWSVKHQSPSSDLYLNLMDIHNIINCVHSNKAESPYEPFRYIINLHCGRFHPPKAKVWRRLPSIMNDHIAQRTMERQLRTEEEGTAPPSSLMAVIRLPPLRLPSPSRKNVAVAEANAPLSSPTILAATLPIAAVHEGHSVNGQHGSKVETKIHNASCQIETATLLVTTPEVQQQGESREGCAKPRAQSHSMQCPEAKSLKIGLSDLQLSDLEPPRSQLLQLVESQEEATAEEALPQKDGTKPPATVVDEQLSPGQSVIVPLNVQSAQFQFERLGEDCYAATTMTLDQDLQNMFDKQLRRRICSILKRLKLNDSRISLECAMIGSKRTPTAMKPTILCMCLAQDQRKAIVNAFGRMSFIPEAFSYKVIISEVRKSSPGNSPPHLGSMIGRTVEVIFHKQLETLCGTPMRTLLSDDGSKYAKSTIGGLIVVNESLFALTTAHGFASTIKETSFLDKDGYPERSLTTKPLNATPTFKPLGTIHSYEWTDNYNHEEDELEDLQDYEDATSQDWALIDIQPPLYVRNSFSFLDESINIEGYLPVDDLTFGEVHICSSNSGIQKAILSGSTASVLMDKLLFEVRSISLEHELGNLILLCSSLCSVLT